MTRLGVTVFSIATGLFGLIFGYFVVGSLGDALAGCVVGIIFGYFVWDSMRLRDMP